MGDNWMAAIVIDVTEDGFDVYYPNSDIPETYFSIDNMFRHIRRTLQSMAFKDDEIVEG